MGRVLGPNMQVVHGSAVCYNENENKTVSLDGRCLVWVRERKLHLLAFALFEWSCGQKWLGSVVSNLLGNLLFPWIIAQIKVGCDHKVLRMVSSGKHINRVTFEYRQLEPYELENPNGNSIQEFCLSTLWINKSMISMLLAKGVFNGYYIWFWWAAN